MMEFHLRSWFVCACLLLGAPSTAAPVQALFDPDRTDQAPFPSNRFTEPDPTQITGLRVKLPEPDCTVEVSLCADIATISELDGFNVSPLLSIPFDGPVDLESLTSDSIQVVELNRKGMRRIKINQIVWAPDSNTVLAETDKQLEQHTPHLLLVTNNVVGADGVPVDRSPRFEAVLAGAPGLSAYELALRDGLLRLSAAQRAAVVSASWFTTLSVSFPLERLRQAIHATPPPVANFHLRGAAAPRTVFPTLPDIPLIRVYRQDTTAPAFALMYCSVSAAGGLYPPAYTGTVAFGSFASPQFIDADSVLPPFGSLTGMPAVLRTEEIVFNLFLPRGARPAGGWPVAIFNHGGGGTKISACALHDELNAAGIAVIAIAGVGHDLGPLGYVEVEIAGSTVSFPWGGRSQDRNGDGVFGTDEGIRSRFKSLTATRDGVMQTVADVMQLTRLLSGGVDVDGDGVRDLDPLRIYQFGHSFGGTVGALFAAVEPNLRANMVFGTGSSQPSITSPYFRGVAESWLGARIPSMLNLPPPPAVPTTFDEEKPLRNEPPRVLTLQGAEALQRLWDRREWIKAPADTGAMGAYLRPPPEGCLPTICQRKNILVAFAVGDTAAPPPNASAMIRAGRLEAKTSYLRWDRYMADHCPTLPPWLPRTEDGNSHDFLYFTPPELRAVRKQMALYFVTNGAVIDILDPRYWEVPVTGPLPEVPGFTGPCP